MSDLTEMVEWLRSVVEGDKTDAYHDIECPQHPDRWIGGPFGVCECEAREVVARCEAELEIVDAFAHWDHPGRFADMAAQVHWTVLGQVVQRLAYARRHRPGWKDEWRHDRRQPACHKARDAAAGAASANVVPAARYPGPDHDQLVWPVARHMGAAAAVPLAAVSPGVRASVRVLLVAVRAVRPTVRRA